jgi:hypothetical protein
MKLLLALLVMVAAPHARADCQDYLFEHSSAELYLAAEYSQGCYAGEVIIKYAKLSQRRPQRFSPGVQMKSVPFVRECPSRKKSKEGDIVEFRCRKDGVTPLAGATYRFTEEKTTMECDGAEVPDVDFIFVCIRGCKPTTPQMLWIPHGEGCS